MLANIPCCICISVNYSISPPFIAFSIFAPIKSVPDTLFVFNFLIACLTSVDVIWGPLSSLISGRVTLSYSYPIYSVHMFTRSSFSETVLPHLPMNSVIPPQPNIGTCLARAHVNDGERDQS